MGEAPVLRDRVRASLPRATRRCCSPGGRAVRDSGGLGELVRCSYPRECERAVKLMGLTTRITDLLAITKLLNVFETFETEQEAIASYMAPA